MPTVYVYNQATNQVERYNRGWADAMPYNVGRTMTVREFAGSSCSDILWTDRRAMQAWNQTRAAFGAPIPVFFAFKRIWEGGHGSMSQHYAGVAFDAGQTMTAAQRARLHQVATSLGVWTYVEPLNLTPTWVHMDRRLTPPACATGYPLQRRGSRGVYVFVLQDALNALGFTGGGLDGLFGAGTAGAVRRYQQSRGLAADGVVGCRTWTALTNEAHDIGPTSTVVGGCRPGS